MKTLLTITLLLFSSILIAQDVEKIFDELMTRVSEHDSTLTFTKVAPMIYTKKCEGGRLIVGIAREQIRAYINTQTIKPKRKEFVQEWFHLNLFKGKLKLPIAKTIIGIFI